MKSSWQGAEMRSTLYIGSSRFNQGGATEVRNYQNYLEKSQKEDFSLFTNFL